MTSSTRASPSLHPPAAAPSAPVVLEPWRQPGPEVAARLGTDPIRGLETTEATARLERYGRNELIERRSEPAWQVLLRQVASPMILVLLVAAGIVAVIGDLKDTIVILAIVVLNALIGFVQEYRAERAMAALRRLTSPRATVIRDGASVVVAAPEIVPGELVALAQGDLVTADLRLLDVHGLRINEAALTGESEPAEKTVDPLPGLGADELADQRNMAFAGTAVTSGRATGVAVATGMDTALGHVAELVQRSGSDTTPLQRRLARLGAELAALALIVCALVFTMGLLRGEALDVMFLTAVSLAVAAIPEGLPAVITIALALGAHRMAARHALVRRLPAVETLGSVTTICSDKTGTLTENRMLVERAWIPTGAVSVGGHGYQPAGSIEPVTGARSLAGPELRLDALARAAALCNDATLVPPVSAREDWSITGDPTEGALLAFAGKCDLDLGEVRAAFPRLAELSFEAARQRMTTLHRDGAGVLAITKGAPEAVIPRLATADAAAGREALSAAERLADDGYRVLAVAERSLAEVPDPLETAEQELRLLGLVAMADPPRATAAPAIAACRAAGITPVMISGDHLLTAGAIARRLGILDEGRIAITGRELAAMTPDELDEAADRIAVYARTGPDQKVAIVESMRRRGAVVAMTGDGVNDAPALRLADIGVAMGITGSEVSKEASDMILADDDFATIVSAVQEGRRIYDNIRRFLRYLLTTNSAEVWVMAFAPLLGLPIPLIAVQILWINLVTDGLPALALGVEPVHASAMRRPPRPQSESILGDGLWQQAVRVGLLMAGVTLVVQALALNSGWAWQTMVFTTLALLQLGNAVAVRSTTDSAIRLGVRTNLPLAIAVTIGAVLQLALVYVTPLHGLFETQALSATELAVVLVASSAGFAAVELEKWWARRRRAAVAGNDPGSSR